jgi:uncharacterized cupin superfamily protein
LANVYEPDFDRTSERQGFRWQGEQVGMKAGAEHLGASVYELSPGEAMYPYHFHFANEELLIVLRGSPHLRSPEGWRQLEEGEVVAFPVGERGAHQVINRSDVPVRLVMVSEMVSPDVVVYPDSGKVGARERAPGSGPGGIRQTFRSEDQVDYWEDEQPPEVPS